MYVNRAHALLLVGTIAAACAPAKPDDEVQGETTGDASGGNGGAATASAGTGQGGGGTQVGAGGTDVGSGGTSGVGGTTAEGTYSCDDDAGSVLTCSEIQSVACEGLELFLEHQCEVSAGMMKPGVASAARSCMLALQPAELCEPLNIYACIDEALQFSCPDTSADDECTAIVATCAESLVDISAESCSTTLSGMAQSGRDRMVQCMSGWCDLYLCVEGLGVAPLAGPYGCNDDVGTPPSCSDLQSVACEGYEPFLDGQCAMVEGVMKPAIASIARACMIALQAPDLCDATNIYACADEALQSSCPDASADDECATIVTSCAESLVEVSAEACSSRLSGMTQAGRDQMVECMATSCDLYTCVEGLTYPATE